MQESKTPPSGVPVNTHCPWSGNPVSEDSKTLYRGQIVAFCNPGCRDKFEKATSLFDAAIEGHKN